MYVGKILWLVKIVSLENEPLLISILLLDESEGVYVISINKNLAIERILCLINFRWHYKNESCN